MPFVKGRLYSTAECTCKMLRLTPEMHPYATIKRLEHSAIAREDMNTLEHAGSQLCIISWNDPH